ncbi:hypothetical protein C8R46DRAFT_366465 [Mycena filopes]|nr:hypothetical protein C8R46DRAFT_366465 [Mycena filopes]
MSSLDALNARIDRLSSAIDLQKQVLRELETQMSDARRELNTLRDPMARLPLEISSEIFMQCLPGDDGSTPMSLLAICHLWSDIALSTPSLWATVFSDIPDTPGFCQHFQTWLARARSFPLSISLHGHITTDVSAVLKQHAAQVQTLELGIESPEQLEEMITTPFPTLQKLFIGNTGRDSEASYLRDCVETMRASPTLRSCQFTAMTEAGGAGTHHAPPHLIHSSLRQLLLGKPPQDQSRGGHRRFMSSCRLLTCLTLPSLEDLLISWLDIPTTEFVSFLRRSSPPLQSLHMTLGLAAVESNWIPLVPSLVSLTLTLNSSSTPNSIPILSQMARDNNILPNLRDLSVTCWPKTHETYQDLVTVIKSRQTAQQPQLRSFKLIFPFFDYAFESERKPNAMVIEVLSPFVDEGIQIHIGPEKKNYIRGVNDRESGSEM